MERNGGLSVVPCGRHGWNGATCRRCAGLPGLPAGFAPRRRTTRGHGGQPATTGRPQRQEAPRSPPALPGAGRRPVLPPGRGLGEPCAAPSPGTLPRRETTLGRTPSRRDPRLRRSAGIPSGRNSPVAPRHGRRPAPGLPVHGRQPLDAAMALAVVFASCPAQNLNVAEAPNQRGGAYTFSMKPSPIGSGVNVSLTARSNT